MTYFSCKDLSNEFRIDLDCCDSCHEDFDLGYFDLMEKEIDEKNYKICCRMFERVKKLEEKDEK